MTNKERLETIQRLKARLECDTRQVKGNANICNPPYMCEECDLCYAQGMLGERNIDLARAIEALSEEAIPIDWIEKKLSEYVCSRKYSSDSLPVIYSLISDWRKENAGS